MVQLESVSNRLIELPNEVVSENITSFGIELDIHT